MMDTGNIVESSVDNRVNTVDIVNSEQTEPAPGVSGIVISNVTENADRGRTSPP